MSPAISVGSVEVDVLPNATGVRARLQQQLLPAANSVGDEVGRVLGRYVTSHLARAVVQGVTSGGRQAQAPAVRQGQATGSAFARSFKGQLRAALADLPEIRLRADSSDAERELYQIRAQMRALADARIGIDVSTATATAAMQQLQARLDRLSASDADVQIRVDAAAASSQLAAFNAQVNRLDGRTANVDVDTRSATAGLSAMTSAALLFGPAILPVLPVVAAGLGAIAAAGVAAGAGLGAVALVAVPAFKQIGGVLQAQKAAQDAAAQSTERGGQAAAQAASRANTLAGAQQSLAAAERNGARQIAQAQQQVAQARQQAADVAAQAARQVQDAERSLGDAQVAAKKAQLDLTAARRQAAQELQDLNNQLTDSVLSQRDAEIQLKEATAQRNAVLQNANASELDKQKALLAYDQAVQRLKEQTTETGRLKAETAAANKAGVEGSNTFKSAQDNLAQAQQKVADQQRAVRDAQVTGAKQIAQAQQRVSEATANVAVAQQNAADSVTSAQRQIQSASLSTAGSVDQAAIAQADYQKKLAALSPAARDTMRAYTDLRGAFSGWSKALQPAVMPVFTRALDGIRKALPKLTPFVYAAARAIGTLLDKASKELKTPFWKGFKDDLQKSVYPAIVGFGVGFGNVIKGIAGIIDGFLPHMDTISGTMQRITGRFADWGTSLKGSPEFERFLSYSAEMGPIVWQTLKKITGAVFSLAKAMAPVSTISLEVIGLLADGITWIATKAPWVVTGIYGIVAAMTAWKLGVAAWAGAQFIANNALKLFNLISKAGPWGWIALAIAALVVGVIYAYKHFEWFRDGVNAVWAYLKSGASAAIDWFKGPFLGFFTKTIPAGFQIVLDWVKRYWPYLVGALGGPMGVAVVYIIRHWDKVKSGFASAWDWIKRWVISPIGTFFTKTIPGWATTLQEKTVAAFNAAKDGIKNAWDQIKAITKVPVQYVVDVVYNNGIRKVWNLVNDAFDGKHHLDVMKFATGGIMPGYTPGRDVHLVSSAAGPVALSGGEAIMRPEWTRAVGSGYVNAMNAAARSGGVGGVQAALGFKDGGIFSGIGDVASGAWDKVKAGASWLKDTLGAAVQAGVSRVVNPLINHIPGGGIGFVGLLKDLMRGAVARIVGASKTAETRMTPHIDYKAAAGVAQWRPVVLQALREVGQPSNLVGSTLRRMNQESGGNPTIVNKWDSNWQAGHPSVGLMQVIGPTFRSYAGKYRNTGPFSYGVSVNPLANVYSSMKYALGAYGSLSRAYDRAGGYDSGGYLQPGMNLAFNGTGKPEPVFTTGQANALFTMAGQSRQQQLGDLQVRVFVGNEEMQHIARTEVYNAQQQLISVLDAS